MNLLRESRGWLLPFLAHDVTPVSPTAQIIEVSVLSRRWRVRIVPASLLLWWRGRWWSSPRSLRFSRFFFLLLAP